MRRLHRPASQHGRIKWTVVVLVFVVLFALAAAAGLLGYKRMYSDNLLPVNAASSEVVVVTIPTGTSSKGISTILKDKNLIRSTWAFERYLQSSELGGQLKAGTYKFSQSMSVQRIAEAMAKGDVAVDLFTILPGQRIDQIKQAFLDAQFDAAVVETALNPATYAGHPALVDKPEAASLEGYLYPDSYQKTAESTPQDIVGASLDEMGTHLTPDLRTKFAAQKLSVFQAITLASIVEREVNTQDERAKAAQVFLKRLSINMPLGSDVTVMYGSVKAGKSKDDLTYDSPYNTHIHPGLPVGPISNVSASGLEAVANPAQTDYLYFVSGDDGITYFSKTNEEHEALTKAHCKKLCGRE